MLQRPSIFRQLRNQCSPCFEIRGTVGCKPQHSVGVNSKLHSCLHLTFGQITQMTFQNGSCGRLAAANPSCCDYPSDPSSAEHTPHHFSSKLAWPAGGAGRAPEGKRPAQTLPTTVGLGHVRKDLTHLLQAPPELGPEPSPASENCLGKLTQWSSQPLCGGRAVLERLLVTFHSHNLVVLHCTLATAGLHHDLGLPTNSKYAPCLVLCNICYYCKKHLKYKGPGRSTENKGWSLISSNMVIQGVLAGVN